MNLVATIKEASARAIEDIYKLPTFADDILVSPLQGHHARVIRGKVCDVSWWIHYRPFSGVDTSSE